MPSIKDKSAAGFTDRVRSIKNDGEVVRVSFLHEAAYYQLRAGDPGAVRLLQEAYDQQYPVSVRYEIGLAGCAEIRDVARAEPERSHRGKREAESLRPHQLKKPKL